MLGKFKGTNDSTNILQVSSIDSLPYYSKDGITFLPLVDTSKSPGIKFTDTLIGHPIFTQAKYTTQSAKNILDSGNTFGHTLRMGTVDSNGVVLLTNSKEGLRQWKDGGVTLYSAVERGSNVFAINKKVCFGDSAKQNVGVELFPLTPFPNTTVSGLNVSFGINNFQSLTVGQQNNGFGYHVFSILRAGTANNGFGLNVFAADTAGINNSGFGHRAFNTAFNCIGCTGFGANVADGKFQMTNCTYIGSGAGDNNGAVSIVRNITGQLFLGFQVGTQDSTDYAFAVGYNGSNNYAGDALYMYGNMQTPNAWLKFNSNDSVNGTLSVFKLPVYTGTGNADSMIIVPSGTRNTFYKVASAIRQSATLDFPSTASLVQNTLTISVTGAKAGDPVSLGIPSTSTTGIYTAACFADGVVSVIFSNTTASPIDPASGTYTVKVK
jgi:hypothetical protein